MNFTPKKTMAIILLVLMAIGAAAIVPFPPTRSAADISLYLSSIAGFIGVVLLFWQLLLGTRSIVGIYDKDLSWSREWHKNLGTYGTLFIFLHPLLSVYGYGESLLYIFIPNLSTAYEQAVTWGRVAFIFFAIIWVTSALIRGKIRYRPWKYIHYLSYAALPFVYLHAPTVGPALLQSPALRTGWNVMAAIFVLLLATRARYLFGFGKQAYAVANIEHVADNTHIVTLRPKQRRLNPVAGQFIYLQLGIAREEHPFSVLGYDKDSGVIRVAFKELGRFTRRSAKLVPGKIVYIDGPYGKFTHEMTDKKRPSVVIAGGIGATPFLQSVTDGNVETLFYSTKYEDNAPFDSFFADSLGDKYIHLVTDAEPISKHSRAGRFNSEAIQSHIKDPQRFNYFVCGPKPFMNAVRTALVSSGVSADQIHAEEFTF